MTMKMISSTSTTSTSGVMLISDCRSECIEFRLNCMLSLSSRLCAGALGDQSHTAEAGLVDREHHAPNLTHAEPCVAADHDLGVRIGARRSAEGFAELLFCDPLIVDPQPARLVNRDQDPASLIALFARFRRVRQVNIRSLPHLWCHDHEDDQQHEYYVDKR